MKLQWRGESDLLRLWNMREIAPWRSLSGCRVETRLDPRPDESGLPSGPCRHECLRHVLCGDPRVVSGECHEAPFL